MQLHCSFNEIIPLRFTAELSATYGDVAVGLRNHSLLLVFLQDFLEAQVHLHKLIKM